jgi:hypothetical protein
MSTRATLWYVESGELKRKYQGDEEPPPPPDYDPWNAVDPGEGEYLVGYALGPGATSISAARGRVSYPGDSKVSVIHDYSSNGQGVDTASANACIAAGFIPSQSMKFNSAGGGPTTAASIASGARDSWIATMATYFNSIAPWPFIGCYHHEPGGDFGTGTQGQPVGTQAMRDYRDAYRRIVTRCRDVHGVTNVLWTPILETPWNFAGSSVGGSPNWMDFRMWHADWDWRNGEWFADVLMDFFGFDLYTPMIGGSSYRQMSTDIGYIKTDLAATGAPSWPFAMFEFGMNNDATGHNWVDYGTKARNFMQANNVKLVTYWDNSADTGRYSMGPRPSGHTDTSDFDDNGTKEIGWATIVDAGTKWSDS